MDFSKARAKIGIDFSLHPYVSHDEIGCIVDKESVHYHGVFLEFVFEDGSITQIWKATEWPNEDFVELYDFVLSLPEVVSFDKMASIEEFDAYSKEATDFELVPRSKE